MLSLVQASKSQTGVEDGCLAVRGRQHPNYRRHKDRSRVERIFGKLKKQRRIVTRYDKNVLSFESFLNLAATRL
jgi:transposase